ncbi:MAG: hypothetical protein AAGI11_06745 [Pseudomonadota bacterium]
MNTPFNAVVAFFDALSQGEAARIRTTITRDFSLLEHGQLWDADKLISAAQGEYDRVNAYHVIEECQQGDLAWLSYWNRARIVRGCNLDERLWLESVVLIRDEELWKVKMLHSTRTAQSNLPQDVRLVEMTLS